MVLRLNPSIPLVWRDPTTLQLGVDPLIVVVPEVTPGIERLIAVLTAGVSETGYPMLAGTFGVTPRQADRLLAALDRCLLLEPTVAHRRRAAVLGDGPLAHGIARVLDEAGLRTTELEHPQLIVLVGDRVIAPAEHRGWLQRDIPHLAVVTSDAAITIGHIVEPGVTACLHCLDLHRRDADPAWPAIATQLAMLAAPAPHPLRTASAIAHAARIVAERLGDGATCVARELRITGDGDELSERLAAPHPDCRCATRPESDWAPADDPAVPRPTRRARASAAPV